MSGERPYHPDENTPEQRTSLNFSELVTGEVEPQLTEKGEAKTRELWQYAHRDQRGPANPWQSEMLIRQFLESVRDRYVDSQPDVRRYIKASGIELGRQVERRKYVDSLEYIRASGLIPVVLTQIARFNANPEEQPEELQTLVDAVAAIRQAAVNFAVAETRGQYPVDQVVQTTTRILFGELRRDLSAAAKQARQVQDGRSPSQIFYEALSRQRLTDPATIGRTYYVKVASEIADSLEKPESSKQVQTAERQQHLEGYAEEQRSRMKELGRGILSFWNNRLTSRQRILLTAGLLVGASAVVGPVAKRGIDRLNPPYALSDNPDLHDFAEAYEKSSAEDQYIDRNKLIEHEHFLSPGVELHTGDILYYASLLSNKLSDTTTSPAVREQYLATLQLLASAKKRFPQAVAFTVKEKNGALGIEPLDWQQEVEVRQEQSTDLLIVGGELEAIVAAMRASKHGSPTTLLYQDGRLGGLNARNGANMAYFDGVNGEHVKPPEELREIFRDALGMPNIISIPNDDLDLKLKTFLLQRYPGITLLPTQTLRSVHITPGEQGKSYTLLTQEGAHIRAERVVDMHPDSLVTEKLIGPRFIHEVDANTANLAYGMVFTTNAINRESYRILADKERVHPDVILKKLGIDKSILAQSPYLQRQYDKTVAHLADHTHLNSHFNWGYAGMANGYDFFSHVVAEMETNPAKRAELRQLNDVRTVDHFNVAIHPDGSATWNSLSYNLEKRYQQGSHSIQKDKELAFLRNLEAPLLEHYIELVTNEDIQIELPNELYVRQQTLYIPTRRPRSVKALSTQPPWFTDAKNTFKYYYDTRGVKPRDAWDATYTVTEQIDKAYKGKPLYLKIDPIHTETRYPNFYAVNKNTQSPVTFPVARIQQFAAQEAVALVDEIVR